MRLHTFSFFFLFAFTVTLIRACPDEELNSNSKRDDSFFKAIQSIWKRCPDHDSLMKRIAINLNERDQFDKEKIGKHVNMKRDRFSPKDRNLYSLCKRSLSHFVRRRVDKTFWPAIKKNKSKKRQEGATNTPKNPEGATNKPKKHTSHDAGAPFPLKRSSNTNDGKKENSKRKTSAPSPSNNGGENSNGNNFDSIKAKRESRMPPEVPIVGPIHSQPNKRDNSRELRSDANKRDSPPVPPPVPPTNPKKRANKAPMPEIPTLPPILDRELPNDAI